MCEVEFWEVSNKLNEGARTFRVVPKSLVDCRIADLESWII